MAELAEGEVARPPVRLRRNWMQRLALELAALVAALLLLAVVGLVLVDTDPGHRFVADRIARMETASGLKIRIGRIDGSLFGKATLRNVSVADPQGVFLTAPEIALDWAPGAWLYNSLHIDRLDAPRVTLSRLPKLRPSPRKAKSILPGFDLHIGQLTIARLELLKGVTGQPRSGRVEGRADIRAGRAMIDLKVRLEGGGDRLAALLDAEPDRDRFDVDIRLTAPANGLTPALLGWKRPMALVVAGNGSWSRWRGAAALDLSGRSAARLVLGADRGRYRLQGRLAPAQFLTGKLQRLTTPVIAVAGDGTLRDRQLSGRLRLASPALRTVATGTLDLANAAYDGVTVGVDLLKPPALFPNMRGQKLRMVWTLDGPFATAAYSYRLTSPRVQFDATGFVDVKAEGRGKLSRWPMRVPLRLTARAVTGLGDVAGAILANVRIDGMLAITPKLVRGDGLTLTSDKLKAKLSLLIDLVTGRFDVLLSGGMSRYLIPGLGIVDVTSDLHVVPGPGGKGTRVVGTGKAWVRRLDNSFFLSLTGGLPRIETALERTADGVLHFTNLQLYSPSLRLSGSGYRRRDGSFHIEASGRQAKYGPLRMILDGPINRPRVDLLLASPNAAMGLRGVRLLLEPTIAGFDYRASGGSTLGEFTSNGQILLPAGGAATIAVAALDVSGTHATGTLRSDPGGFTGQLALSGALGGQLQFQPVGGNQRIEAHLLASNASFTGPVSLSVRRGRLDGTILLAERATTVSAVVNAAGVSAAGIQFSRLVANAQLVNGSGQVRAAVAGRRGTPFDLTATADVSPDRLTIRGQGQVDRRPLQLATPAVLVREPDGWRIEPTRLRFAGGSATLSGRTGARPEINAELSAMPLALLDMLSPGTNLGGTANGRLAYRWANGRPSGRADLRLRQLTRSGLTLASQPIDVGVAAVIDGNRAAIRAVAASGGSVIGRAQARFAPLPGGPVAAALLNAPLFAQLRYAGPADTLWRLTGVELMDLSGPVAIGADIGGRLIDPQIRGSIRAQNAKLQSAVTGMAIDGLNASGSFTGSRLNLASLSGRTAGGGTLTGTGNIDLSGGAPAFDLSFTAARARLLDRDDLQAVVTGPLTIRSSGKGGTIAGNLRLDSGRFRLGRAAAAANIPRLQVRETGVDRDDVIETADLQPWRLALNVQGNALQVTGLGIDSLWRAELEVGGTADSPRPRGQADLVRGEYEFAGRNFRLDRGIIRFNGDSPVDPQLDIRAEADVQGVNASVLVQGTGLRPEISFASVPALPQDELLSRLLFGTSITNLSAPDAVQLASAVAALQSGKGGLDPINAVRRVAGLDRLRILPADVAAGQKTALSAGKYLSRKLFVEVVTDGQGYSATRIEYQMTRWLSLLSSVSTIGRTSANVRISKDY